VLGLFGGADQGIPVDVVKEFEQALADVRRVLSEPPERD
jgi:hypothetical protein